MTLPIAIPGPRVVGIDLSLTSTGIAVISNHQAATTTLVPKSKGHARLAWLADKILEWVADADLILIEGGSYGSNGKLFDIGGGWWVITHALWGHEHDYVVVPPASLKRYATGRGNAKKDEVGYEAVRRFPGVMITNNDQADALWLAHMGCDWMGWPLVTVPLVNRTAMDRAIRWPERASIRKFPMPDPARIARQA